MPADVVGLLSVPVRRGPRRPQRPPGRRRAARARPRAAGLQRLRARRRRDRRLESVGRDGINQQEREETSPAATASHVHSSGCGRGHRPTAQHRRIHRERGTHSANPIGSCYLLLASTSDSADHAPAVDEAQVPVRSVAHAPRLSGGAGVRGGRSGARDARPFRTSGPVGTGFLHGRRGRRRTSSSGELAAFPRKCLVRAPTGGAGPSFFVPSCG